MADVAHEGLSIAGALGRDSGRARRLLLGPCLAQEKGREPHQGPLKAGCPVRVRTADRHGVGEPEGLVFGLVCDS